MIEEIIKKKPYLIEYLSGASENEFQIISAVKGGKSIVYRNIFLSSKYDPLQEAQRIIHRIKFQKHKIIFIFGAGNIHLIQNILTIREENQITILVEYNKNLITFLIKNSLEFINFLNQKNCHVFCNENLHLLWNYINSLKVEYLKGYIIIPHPLSLTMKHKFYQELEFNIQRIFKSNFSSLLTRFEFETLWFRNIFINMNLLHKDEFRNRLIFYRNKFFQIPVTIVGAGPSLSKYSSILKYLSKKTFMIATDASLKPLIKMNIRPHAVHILDGQLHSYFHFRGESLKDIIIFADMVIHPLLIKKLKPKMWIFSSTAKYYFDYAGNPVREMTPGMNLVQKLIGEIGSLQSGGSVATSAFEIARFLGAGKIFLIGVDLSWLNRQIHCWGTYHYENWICLINRLQTLENINEKIFQNRIKVPVPSYSGNLVYGDHVMNLYRFWFEETLSQIPIPVYNINSYGARIENTISVNNPFEIQDFGLMDLENFIEKNIQVLLDSYKHKFYEHKENTNIIRQLQDLLLSDNKKFYESYLDIINQYEDLKVFSHKLETYIQRNLSRLTEDRIERLRYSEIKREILLFIKFYNSFNTSLIH